jgi:hypothetical protein
LLLAMSVLWLLRLRVLRGMLLQTGGTECAAVVVVLTSVEAGRLLGFLGSLGLSLLLLLLLLLLGVLRSVRGHLLLESLVGSGVRRSLGLRGNRSRSSGLLRLLLVVV